MASTTLVRGEAAQGRGQAIDDSLHDSVLEQVERIAASPFFRHSKHYPAFLRYVVDQSLKGRASELKERVLGFEVFGRDPDYDTSLDPVVRNSACEVRKRIAQYYLEPAHASEIRIELSAGSYIPEFSFPERQIESLQLEPAFVLPSSPEVAQPVTTTPLPIRSARTRVWIGCFISLAIVLTAALVFRPKDAMQEFWSPLWDSSDVVMIGVSGGGNQNFRRDDQPYNPTTAEVMRNDHIAFADGLTLARITGLLGRNGKSYDIRRQATFSLTDLHKEPAVFIGGFNNEWSMRLADKLRFTLGHDPQMHTVFVQDKQNPSARNWTGNPGIPYSQLTEDYAIVSRFLDDRTEKMVVMLAGMGKDGTAAAGEFVTTPRYMDLLRQKAPRDWAGKNLQVVLGTEIVNGNAGPPHILAVHFW
jgi:hypothetical protein